MSERDKPFGNGSRQKLRDRDLPAENIRQMRIQTMHIGMKVRHAELGVGTVKSLSEYMADIRFDTGLRSLAPEQSELEPAEVQAQSADWSSLKLADFRNGQCLGGKT